jgi:hypothetical protein
MGLFHAGAQQALDSNANPISGATWNFYLYGTTTSTRVFSDDTLLTSLGSTVTANGNGRFANIYLDETIATRAVLKDSSGATIKDIPLVNGFGRARSFITPEAFGCPDYAEGTNQRAYLAVAFAFGQTYNVPVYLGQREYEVWAPTYTGGGAGYDNHDTGAFFVVTGQLSIHGIKDERRSTIHFKGPTGGDMLTDFVEVDGTIYGDNCVHRGHAFKLKGNGALAGAATPVENLASLTIYDVNLWTDAVASFDTNWPATIANPNRLDITHKAIFHDYTGQTGMCGLYNVHLKGWFGESYFGPNANYPTPPECGLRARNLKVEETNAQGLNPNGGTILDVDGLWCERCAITLEGYGGRQESRVTNAVFKDCPGIGNIVGTGADETRPDGSGLWTYFQGRFENCGEMQFGSWLRAEIVAVDTQIAVCTPYGDQKTHSVEMDLIAVLNEQNAITPLRFTTLTPLATYPNQLVSNCRVNLTLRRTSQAIAAPRYWNAVLFTDGRLGENNEVRIKGGMAALQAVSIGANLVDWRVAIIDENVDTRGFSSAFPTSFNAMTNPTIDPGYGWLRGTFTAASTARQTVSLPATTNFNHGHECWIEHRDGNATSATMLVDGRVLLGYRDRVKIVCNKQHARWDIAVAPKPRKVTASINITSTALGSESGPYTIAVPGCSPDMIATVAGPASPGTAGFAVTAVRAETDQVKFWVKNMDGANPADPAAENWTAYVRGPEV